MTPRDFTSEPFRRVDTRRLGAGRPTAARPGCGRDKRGPPAGRRAFSLRNRSGGRGATCCDHALSAKFHISARTILNLSTRQRNMLILLRNGMKSFRHIISTETHSFDRALPPLPCQSSRLKKRPEVSISPISSIPSSESPTGVPVTSTSHPSSLLRSPPEYIENVRLRLPGTPP